MKTLVLANHKGGVGKSAVATLARPLLRAPRQAPRAGDRPRPPGQLQRAAAAVASGPRSRRLTSDRLLTTAAPRPCRSGFVLVPAGRRAARPRAPADAAHARSRATCAPSSSAMDAQFDVCVIDTHPNPDIRLIAALASADFVLSPIQLNQEAIDGVRRCCTTSASASTRSRRVLNPKLHLIGLLPTMVEATPFQRANFVQVVEHYRSLLIPLSDRLGRHRLDPEALGDRRGAGRRASCSGR